MVPNIEGRLKHVHLCFWHSTIQDNLSESLPTQKWEGLEAVWAHSDGANSQVG